MIVDLSGTKCTVFGIQGTGKTHLAKTLAKDFQTFVYSPHGDEWESEQVYGTVIGNFIADFPAICTKVKEYAIQGKITMFIIDEADMLFRSNFDLLAPVNDLMINHRHYNLAIVLVTRRPQDIPTKILESCKYLFAFAIEGDNAVKKLNNISTGFGDLVKVLQYTSHEFYVKEIGKAPVKNRVT